MPMVYASKKIWNQFLDLHSYLSILEILYEQICNCCVNTVHCRNQYYFKKRCSTIVYYLTFLEVLGCLSLSIALWDIPWVDFKAAYYEEVGIAATDHIKRAGHVLSVDTAGVQVPHYIHCLPSLPQKEQAWHLHVSMRTPCSGWACIRQTPAFLPSYQRASLRQCAPQRCPVLVLTVVLDNQKGVVRVFSQLRKVAPG